VYGTEASASPSDAGQSGGGLDEGPFGFDVVGNGDGVVMVLRGELDLASAPELQRELLALLDRPVGSLTLDLGGLTFLDSSGLGALYRAHQEAEEGGVTLRLQAVPDHVMQVLDVTAMASLFDLDRSA
jgi:anti-sigma B factor antagonist